MRRLSLATALAALLLAPSAQAQLDRYPLAGGEWLSLDDGRGLAVLRSRAGAVFGNLGRGRLAITDFVRGKETEIDVSGCEKTARPAPRLTVCTGRHITFSILGGAWRARIRGVRINASAVMRGSVTLQGTDGDYRLRGGDAHPWPSEPRTFLLAQ